MKSKDLKNIGLSKHQKDDIPIEVHHDLKPWNQFSNDKKVVPDNWSIWLYSATRYTCCPTDGQGTKENIQKVESRLHRKQKVSARKLSRELLQQVSDEY